MLLRFLVALAVIYVTRRTIAFRKATRSVGNLGGYRVLWDGLSPIGRLVGRIPGLSQGSHHPVEDKYSVHERVGCDIVAHIVAFPPSAHLFLADAQAIKEVTYSRAKFPKPVDRYESLLFFGSNIVASEGELWKMYRKLTAPSFSDRNNKLVWNETINILNDLFDYIWGDKDVITVDHLGDLALPMTLFVIGSAGFGHKMSWKQEEVVPAGHKMTFQKSLHIVSTSVLPMLLIPKWVMKLTATTREIDLGFREFRAFMLEMIDSRLKSESLERDDLLSALLDANNNDDGETLTTDELIGNIFIFLLAGHETTAYTLCFAFALLALYPDEQEKLYEHIKSVLPSSRRPTYEDMPLFTQSLAVLYETLRLFPPVPVIPKRCAEDTTLSTTDAYGEIVTIPVPAGTEINIDTPALHYNPKYWEDPHSFNPDRFSKTDWNRDAFLPFSGAARACLGRRFAEAESVATITMIVSRYKVSVKEEPQFAHETFEQKYERIMRTKSLLTLTPLRIPLVFTLRS